MIGLYMGKTLKQANEKVAIRVGFDKNLKKFKIVEIAHQLSYVSVTTNPSAEIFINGEKRGDGEFTDIMKIGTYEVEIVKDGFYPQKDTWTLVDGGEVVKNYTLNQVLGNINITSNPSHSILIVNGINKGYTPLIINDLVCGEHTIEIRSPHYPAKTRIVNIKDTSTVGVSIDLTVQNITINTNPKDANIILNGESKGYTPLILDVKYGENSLLLKKEDYVDLQQILNNERNKLDYNFTLIPIETQRKLNLYQNKKILWLSTSLVMFGAGTYFYKAAETNYETYKTATTNAADLHKKIALYSNLATPLLAAGALCLVPFTISTVKHFKLKREIKMNFALVPMPNHVSFALQYNF